MVLKYIVSPSAFTEDFLIRIWEASNDQVGAHVHEETLVEKNGAGVPTPGAGHQVIETIIVNGLDKVVHIVRMYGATSGNLYHEANVEPRVDLVTVFEPIRFKIGDGGTYTPAVNTGTFTHPILVGLEDGEYIVHRNGQGDLHPGGVHYNTDSVGGSFSLIAPDVFGPDEEVTVKPNPIAVSTVVNDSVVAKWFGQTPASDDIFLDVAANINYDAAHLRKLIRLAGSAEYSFTIDPPIGYAFIFNKYATVGTAKVKFVNAVCKWVNSTVNELNMPDGSELCVVFDGTVWNVVYYTNKTAVAPYITQAGSFNIGDAGGNITINDSQHTIPLAIAEPDANYIVVGSLVSKGATMNFDNDVIPTIRDKATNSFKLLLREVTTHIQNLTFDYAIIRTP